MNFFSDSSIQRLVLLAPQQFTGLPGFGRLSADETRHDDLLKEMQRFRGAIYLSDGAIKESDLTVDGRHCQHADSESWHVLSVGKNDVIKGCSRYRQYPESARFCDLGVSQSEIAHSEVWGSRLAEAVQNEVLIARQRGIGLVEVGGWAIAKESRFSTDALRLALSTFALARKLGGCIGLTTATVRHCSAAILRKLGGRSLHVDGQEIPKYFDAAYDCDMEILRFDSEQPNARYVETLDRLTADLTVTEVVSADMALVSAPVWVVNRERTGAAEVSGRLEQIAA